MESGTTIGGRNYFIIEGIRDLTVLSSSDCYFLFYSIDDACSILCRRPETLLPLVLGCNPTNPPQKHAECVSFFWLFPHVFLMLAIFFFRYYQ